MTIIIFILVLVALIVVHEFGHFVVAKLSKMRVDEFGIGYPPRAWGFKKGETEYTLNWLPFGGFVKIYGEDMEDHLAGEKNPRAFSARPRILQAATLVAGIAMNLLFAYILITATLVMGTPRALAPEELSRAEDISIVVASTVPGSPAESAGLLPGDVVRSIEGAGGSYTGSDANLFTAFVSEHQEGSKLLLHIERNGVAQDVEASPKAGLIKDEPDRAVLGIGLATVGTIKESFGAALWDGVVLTVDVTKQTAIALVHFFADIFTFKADLSQVSGPVGIAGAVGHASDNGLAALMTITALISINLALINLLPIPALDGGRLLFVIIEAITRRPIKPVVANAMNGIGFALLILLMLVVTAHDVFKLIG